MSLPARTTCPHLLLLLFVVVVVCCLLLLFVVCCCCLLLLLRESARSELVVKKSGGLYYVEDNASDVTVKVRVKRLTPIPAFLGELEERVRGGRRRMRRRMKCDALSFSFSRDDCSVQVHQEVEAAETTTESLQLLSHSRCRKMGLVGLA